MTRRRKHLISRAEFARRAVRGRSTITEACAGPLRAACVANRIDAAHAASRAWAESRGIDPAQLQRAPSPESTRPAKRSATKPTDLIAAMPVEGAFVDGHQVWAMPPWAGAPDQMLGTVEELLDAASARGRRLLVECNDAGEFLFDLDSSEMAEFLSGQWGRPCEPADLDRIWAEVLDERAAESAA